MRNIFTSDEKEIAESIFQNGYTERKFNFHEAVLASKYFRFILGYGDTRIKNALIEFTKNNVDYFLEEHPSNREIIKLVLKRSKEEFVETETIVITKSELENIRKIKNFKYQKIAVGLLYIAKRNNGKIYNSKKKILKQILSQNVYKNDVYKTIAQLHSLSLCTASLTPVLEFIDNNSEPIIIISDEKTARNLGNLYVKYCGGELAWCKNCEKEYVKKWKNHKYCDECSREKELESGRKRSKKHYNKNSNGF